MHPFYLIDIDLEDSETEIEFNSIVDYPAHMRAFEAYGKNEPEYFMDEEQRIITGVVIAEGTPIYRKDKQLGEHYVIFNKDAIRKMWMLYNKNGYRDRVNKQHDSEDVINPSNGIFMVEQWIVDSERGMGVPKNLQKQGIRDGSWMMSYKVEDRKLWKEIKAGKYNGFSIEGVFIKYPIKVKKAEQQTSMEQRKIARKLFSIISEFNKK